MRHKLLSSSPQLIPHALFDKHLSFHLLLGPIEVLVFLPLGIRSFSVKNKKDQQSARY
jgi:hypothetical protein